ncbi:hypothetical protein TNCT_135921 [Trichonephila clavata]|uniref:Uncharacterized protein n=1 Tax=Trichonephila clavata TaxID=2740835 RepID=A0A8X6IGE7_TRICU|nr:hypothetical protein TNCT_135921 [Trichonephila clavata]
MPRAIPKGKLLLDDSALAHCIRTQVTENYLELFCPTNHTSSSKHDTSMRPSVILGSGCPRNLPLGTGPRRSGERSGVYGKQDYGYQLRWSLGNKIG